MTQGCGSLVNFFRLQKCAEPTASLRPSNQVAVQHQYTQSLPTAAHERPKQSGPDADLPSDLLYLRAAARLSVFLQQDTAHVLEDKRAINQAETVRMELGAAGERLKHRYVELKHPLIPSSAAAFQPQRDLVWFSHETNEEDLRELSEYYGTQLQSIHNVMFEGGEWDDLDACLELLRFFPSVQTIYVWLDSYRFNEDVDTSTKEDYLEMAQNFGERDEQALKGRMVTVE
ncbi:hypothetical protein NLG97_g686 [Lecanicillium saksenae]|uniref:Uncharacterized protein n=1 Tax=Lecanicillium saksenae TaxID=468837 RepID=A0ACC1R8H5_9HYPO|nr:hypothetical protein NLG97_g686 [Lecanicillium saksenae]